jgi:hypothetical protein
VVGEGGTAGEVAGIGGAEVVSGSGGSAAGRGGSGGSGGSGTPPVLDTCVEGTYGDHDYLFCSEPRSWFDANGGCSVVGMRLVRVDDADENQWLFDNANFPSGPDAQAWLGATDQAVEGEWRWTDAELFWLGGVNGSAQNGLFAGWYFREPNDVGGGEHCASLGTNAATPKWYDSACESAFPYICESL